MATLDQKALAPTGPRLSGDRRLMVRPGIGAGKRGSHGPGPVVRQRAGAHGHHGRNQAHGGAELAKRAVPTGFAVAGFIGGGWGWHTGRMGRHVRTMHGRCTRARWALQGHLDRHAVSRPTPQGREDQQQDDEKSAHAVDDTVMRALVPLRLQKTQALRTKP